MKKCFFLTLFLVAFVACSHRVKSIYTESLSDWAQTEGDIKYDKKFKLISAEDIACITVADSLAYADSLFAANESIKKSSGKWIRDNKSDYETVLFAVNFGGAPEYHPTVRKAKKMWNEENAKYNKATKLCDEANAIREKYAEMDSTFVLWNIVDCIYTITEPETQIQMEISKRLVFSPDGTICLGDYWR